MIFLVYNYYYGVYYHIYCGDTQLINSVRIKIVNVYLIMTRPLYWTNGRKKYICQLKINYAASLLLRPPFVLVSLRVNTQRTFAKTQNPRRELKCNKRVVLKSNARLFRYKSHKFRSSVSLVCIE